MTAADGHIGVDIASSIAPLVTVVMPAYNAEKFILDAIRSVLAQGYPSVEILVIDDGSKDSTFALVQREAPQVRIIQQSNAGAAAARNTGLRLARGKYICFLDADDGWYPGKLSAQVDYLQKHPEAGMVYHEWFVWIPDESGSYCIPKRLEEPAFGEIDPACTGWIYTRLLLDCIVHTSTVMMRLEVVRDIGFFDTTLVTGEDYDYWLRVSRKYQIHKLTGTYSFYRAALGSLTSKPPEENNEYNVLQSAWRKWGLSSQDGKNLSEKLMNKRLGKLAFDFGYSKYYQGEIRQARDSFLKALRHDPFRWRALGYLLVASLRK
jgi:glycosyltransferase involved in cell wall biosynthesis